MQNGETRARVGVVGVGRFGAFHARHFAAHPAAELVAVADIDRGRAAAVGATHGARPFDRHEALIGLVDAVSIAAPSTLHDAIARDFLDAGIHVLLEKPIALDPTAARDLVARAEASGAVLQIGHVERFAPVVEALLAAVEAPLFIDCVRAGTWTGRGIDVDVVVDLMVHDIDLTLALARCPVEIVHGAGSVEVGPHADIAEAVLVFANGVVARLHANRVAEATERTLRVVERERVLTADLAARTLTIKRRGADGTTECEEVAVAPGDALGREIDSFLACVTSGRPPVVGGAAAVEGLLVAEIVRRDLQPRFAPARARALAAGG